MYDVYIYDVYMLSMWLCNAMQSGRHAEQNQMQTVQDNPPHGTQ